MVQFLVMMRYEGMTMKVNDKARRQKRRRKWRSQGDGRISWMDIEITKNYNRDSS